MIGAPALKTRHISLNRPKHTALVALLLSFAGAGPGTAQEALRRDYWKHEFLPLAYPTTSRGLFVGGRFHVYAPVPYDWPETNAIDVGITALGSTSGAYDVHVDLHAPAWVDGWRIRLGAGIERDPHLAYFGIGNDTEKDPAFSAADAYDLRRRVSFVRADIQRRLVGPVRVLAGAGLRRSEFDAISPQTRFATDLAAGTVDDDDRRKTVPFVRGGMVIDIRDSEVSPRRGVFGEILVAGDGSYTRITGHLRGYHSFGRLQLTARLAGERIGGSVPFAEHYFMETSEGRIGALGGYGSHRGLSKSRFLGAGKLLGSADLRYMIFAFPSIGELSVFGFVDAGRVFDRGQFSLSTKGLHWGGGGGLALRLGRNLLLAFSVAGGPDGLRVHGGPGWSY